LRSILDIPTPILERPGMIIGHILDNILPVPGISAAVFGIQDPALYESGIVNHFFLIPDPIA
jgi:hypothetical protein